MADKSEKVIIEEFNRLKTNTLEVNVDSANGSDYPFFKSIVGNQRN